MNDREHSASMERLLREALAAEDRAESPACLDAETLAAWAEGLLAGAERSSAVAHAARCPRCQAMLATLARTIPVELAPSRSPIRKWLVMLGPAVAAAAAVALWFAVDRSGREQFVLERTSSTSTSRVTSSEPPSANATVPSQEADKKADDRKNLNAEKKAGAEEKLVDEYRAAGRRRGPAKLPDARVKADRDAPARLPPAAMATPGAPPGVAGQGQVVQGNRAAEAPQATPPALAGALQQAGQTQAPPPPRQQADQSRVDEPKPVDRNLSADRVASVRERGGGRRGAREFAKEGFAVGRNESAGSFELVSSDASIRWRIVSGRIVEQSRDGGVTWATQHSADEKATLTAGAAPSSTVSWLVGHSGIVLKTIDGRTWQQVKFPETVDLTAVTASDGRSATVTAADGRMFTTTDGGKTWTRR